MTGTREENVGRNMAIVHRYVTEGARVAHLARDYQLSHARVKQILKAHNAARPDGRGVARHERFFQVVSREHMKAVATARLQISQGWAVDPVTRLKLAELFDALDRALDEEGMSA